LEDVLEGVCRILLLARLCQRVRALALTNNKPASIADESNVPPRGGMRRLVGRASRYKREFRDIRVKIGFYISAKPGGVRSPFTPH
jgi:hypothetical protein